MVAAVILFPPTKGNKSPVLGFSRASPVFWLGLRPTAASIPGYSVASVMAKWRNSTYLLARGRISCR